MKNTPKFIGMLLAFLLSTILPAISQTVLIDHNFQIASLPTGVTSDGAVSITKAADGVCSKGMVQVNQGGYMQVDIPACAFFQVNMKSTGAAARTLRVTAKKEGEAAYTTLTSTLSVGTAAVFLFHELYPAIITSAPISIRIEPISGNIQVHDLLVKGDAALSKAAYITSFKLNGQVGDEIIDTAIGAIAIKLLPGTVLNPVAPLSVGLSHNATISPAATEARNFSLGNPVNYTVTAQDGVTTKNWTVTTSEQASPEKEITAFKLADNQIGAAAIHSAAGTINVSMPISQNLSNLTPVLLNISALAGISPAANTARNFSEPVVYTVTAQDNSAKDWTVSVTPVDPDLVYATYEAEEADFTGVVDNKHAGFSGTGFVDFMATGENHISFLVCQQAAGTQTAKFRYSLGKAEDRSGHLYVNGSFVKNLVFTPTPAFTDWAEEMASLNLLAGINTIRITWNETDGPNLDKLSISGAQCASYSLTMNPTNGGQVDVSPQRGSGKYFAGETVTLSAQNKANLAFAQWTGDLTGTQNPAQVAMNSNKTIGAAFNVITTYALNITIQGIGDVESSPAGGQYAAGTEVTLTPKSILGSAFEHWLGDATGTVNPLTVTVNGNKNITAVFTASVDLQFNKVIGFASVSGDGFTGPTTGGAGSTDTVFINGPAEFGKLCQVLQNRINYKNYSVNPLTIVLEEGVYTGLGGQLSVWGNDMLTIQEQGNLTLIGRKKVFLNFGINIKRSFNIIIRNIHFQDYYDDGINIGESETHHIWVDHCTVGHPTTLPANTEHPDGGIDVKAGASYITISWSLYRNSWKTGLIGHSDNNGAEDNGRLKVTHFANYFYNTNSRNPRVRFGEVHVLNCLHEQVKLYGIVASNNSGVVAENNFFLNTRWPMYADRTEENFKAVYGNNTDDVFTSKTGNRPATGLRQTGNAYDDSGLPLITAQINPAMLNPGGRSIRFDELNAAGIFNPHDYYDYEPFPASVARTLVPLFAGADKIDFFAPNSPLPLSLLTFTAKAEAVGASLAWTTENENKVRHFEVERSDDGANFKQIGIKKANNTSSKNDYNYHDLQPLTAITAYRLKMVDMDGSSSYSAVVKLAPLNQGMLKAFPNPATNNLFIEHPLATNTGLIQLHGLDGRLIIQKNIAVQSNRSLLSLTGIKPGIYFISVTINHQKHWLKLSKQ